MYVYVCLKQTHIYIYYMYKQINKYINKQIYIYTIYCEEQGSSYFLKLPVYSLV